MLDPVAEVAVAGNHAEEVEGGDEDHPFPKLAEADLAHLLAFVLVVVGRKDERRRKNKTGVKVEDRKKGKCEIVGGFS